AWFKQTDLIFIDADKERYLSYYEHAIEMLRPGGVIAIDNVLWRGRVTNPEDKKEKTQVLRALNERIHADERVTPVIVPIADGITLAAKRG
ncbi:MAG: SAM-dependent methyltransferase, partial [Okeania sp. SIO3C4]|nr:SAM-dependent methyltransferase [Okeania sp. SIO3C4]